MKPGFDALERDTSSHVSTVPGLLALDAITTSLPGRVREAGYD